MDFTVVGEETIPLKWINKRPQDYRSQADYKARRVRLSPAH